ncbi:hypothetical protein ACTFIZ_003089 [Dictyostelium cf. discoideum]
MSQVYSDFKKSSQNGNINIKEKFHLLRYYYTEIIEKVKKKRSESFNGLWILRLLDDIFLRVFVWIDKKSNSSTDSNNSMAEFENLKNNLKNVTWKNTLRIVFYNQKDPDSDSDADAMLDTNCYHVCRYFMTYCHCLFAIFSNQLSHVPFSRTLLSEYESTYQLNVVESSVNTSIKGAIKIKQGCEFTINNDQSIPSYQRLLQDLSIDQDSPFTINVKDREDGANSDSCVVELTSFGDIVIESSGSVTVDNEELSNENNSIMIYGGKKLLIKLLSGNLTLVSNNNVQANGYDSLTIESKMNTIEVCVTNYKTPENFIKIYSHKTNHMIKKMNEKLGGDKPLILHKSEVSILENNIIELRSEIEKLKESTNENEKIPLSFKDDNNNNNN